MCRLTLVLIVSSIAGCGSSPSEGEVAVGSSASAEPAPEATAGGEQEDEEETPDNEFQLRASSDAGARGERPSQIEATETEAAVRLFVVNGDDVAIPGVVIKMTAPDGSTHFTEPTDSHGYTELLVPAGQRYEMEYLSLGRRDVAAAAQVGPGPRRNTRLTLRYRRSRPLAPERDTEEPGFRLDGVTFETGSATIEEASYPRLDRVVEYMEHQPATRVGISGHTDNVGNPRRNQRLSESRAEAVREYLISHGIEGSRLEAVGHGDTQPLAPNDTEEGRAKNRRIEATEL